MSGGGRLSTRPCVRESGRRFFALGLSTAGVATLASRHASAQPRTDRDLKSLSVIADATQQVQSQLIVIATPPLGEASPDMEQNFRDAQKQVMVQLSDVLAPLGERQINYVSASQVYLAREMRGRDLALVPPLKVVVDEVFRPIPNAHPIPHKTLFDVVWDVFTNPWRSREVMDRPQNIAEQAP